MVRASTAPRLACLAALALAPSAAAQDIRVVPGAAPVPGALDDGAERYCQNIADAAADARFQRQAEALRRMEAEIEARIADLEAKRAETEAWLERREAFLAMAEDGLVKIYEGMRPEAAAQQLAIVNEVAAAAILTKLAVRSASAILNEMQPEKAARLASIMVGIGARDA